MTERLKGHETPQGNMMTGCGFREPCDLRLPKGPRPELEPPNPPSPQLNETRTARTAFHLDIWSQMQTAQHKLRRPSGNLKETLWKRSATTVSPPETVHTPATLELF